LKAYSSIKSLRDITGWRIPPALGRIQNAFVMVVGTDVKELQKPRGLQTSIHIFRAVSRSRSGDGVWGREVPQTVNISLIQDWLNICRSHHRGTCSLSRTAQSPLALHSFQLIDCASQMIVPASGTETYAALSYV
jgi:hypothetical protein